MWLPLTSIFVLVTFLDFITLGGADAELDNSGEVDKRRGWGKRTADDTSDDAEMDNRVRRELSEMDKRRGWGKRASALETEEVDKRRGWGKRADVDTVLYDDMDKRRGWGKRTSDDIDKRRGWGKRAGDELEGDMDKRRGWGKRFVPDELSLAELEKRRGWGKRALDMDKRRGWGKRSLLEEEMDKRRGWGKRASDLMEEVKRRGWGKRSDISNELGVSESCQQLKDEVLTYVYKAVEAEARRLQQCEA